MIVRRAYVAEQERADTWPCHFCGFNVHVEIKTGSKRFVIHHVDHDHKNNEPGNLKAAHERCHSSHHHRGQVISIDQRRKISESRRGQRLSATARKKLSASLKRAWAEGRQRGGRFAKGNADVG